MTSPANINPAPTGGAAYEAVKTAGGANTNPAPSGSGAFESGGGGTASAQTPIPGVSSNPGAVSSSSPSFGAVSLGVAGQSAMQLMQQTLGSWGLSTLSTHLQGLLTQGYTSNTLSYALKQTPEYQARFSGNIAREKAGLPVLAPAQYIALEEQYKQIGAQYGLPKGYMDSKQQTDNWIANDVSPTELDARAQIASKQWQSADPATKNTWQQYYGLSAGSAVAGIMNPETSLQTLQNEAQTVGIGAAAQNAGMNVGAGRATQEQQAGVTLAQARSTYQSIASDLTTQNAINNRFGSGQQSNQLGQQGQQQSLAGTQSQMESADLLHNGQAQMAMRTSNDEEQALFHGHAAANQATMSSSSDY